MKLVAVFALALIAIATVNAVSLNEVPLKITQQVTQDLFDEFVRVHAKNYHSEVEQAYRMKVFSDNLHFIAKHNKEAAHGKHSYVLGVTPFADLTNEEYIQQYLPRSLEADNSTIDLNDDDDDIPHDDDDDDESEVSLPSSVDWRKKGCVGSVRDQKSCGSCWAFAAAALIEGAVAQKTGKLYDVSEQQMVDCDKVSHGCDGGWTDKALQSVISAGGIQSESDYGYCACDRSCKFNKDKVKAKISSVVTVASGSANENAIQSAVAERCGVSVYIYASAREFQLYKSGVFDLSSCSTSINHAVAVVGYDSSNGKPYWIVRNSWGKSWGDDGYIKMVRNKNMCGIGKYSYYAKA